MTDRYPKSREELQDEVNDLTMRAASLALENNSLRVALHRSEAEKRALMRRRAPHALDPGAKDAFRRPLRR